MKPTTAPTLRSKKLRGLLTEYKECAGRLYWEEDQGSPSSTRRAQKHFDAAEAELTAHLVEKERELTKLRNFYRSRQPKVCTHIEQGTAPIDGETK